MSKDLVKSQIKALTDPQVDVILSYCKDEINRSFDKSGKERKRSRTGEGMPSDIALLRCTDLFYDTGYRKGIKYVLEILETRKLP